MTALTYTDTLALDLEPQDGLDLAACDREPIHIPGAIQPHGLLLVADAASLSIVAGAGDIEGRLAVDWLGADLSDLIAQDVAALLADEASPPSGIAGDPVFGMAERFEVVIHPSTPRR
jgi:light-regulated signal transduction histidine kinase (bacteriophytochrome)